ncbi:MAG: peptidase M16, partial [Planctomycetota bacterium]
MVKQEVLHDKTLDEKITKRVYPSGLTVYAVRKPRFMKSYATLATRYGSVDQTVPRDGNGSGKAIALPDGVAHFLEHRIFESPEGDA